MRTDKRGNYSFDNLHPGKYALGFYPNDFWGLSVFEVEVREGESLQFDFRLSRQENRVGFSVDPIPEEIYEAISDTLKTPP